MNLWENRQTMRIETERVAILPRPRQSSRRRASASRCRTPSLASKRNETCLLQLPYEVLPMRFDDFEFFHIIDLPDGRVTPGTTDHRNQPAFLGIDAPGLLAGDRVLDIGANDGFWSFWAEKAGAAEVLATDVDSYVDYDWGFAGPPVTARRQANKRTVFDALHAEFRSKVQREKVTVYDLKQERHGQFDLVLFYGVLYHLRHPLLALDAIRRVCRGCVIVETHVSNRAPFVPQSLFYWDDVFNGDTNWSGPSEACVVAWMKSAGFETIFRQVVAYDVYSARQRFVATLGPKWERLFAHNSRFRRCDQAYFARVRDETRRWLGLPPT